jgi:hypothetical protein
MKTVRPSKSETRVREQFWKMGTCSVREILEGLPEDERVAYTGSRLALYRELSCDESVIRSAHGMRPHFRAGKTRHPKEGFLRQATASSFLSHRLARLNAALPQRTCRAANADAACAVRRCCLCGCFLEPWRTQLVVGSFGPNLQEAV